MKTIHYIWSLIIYIYIRFDYARYFVPGFKFKPMQINSYLDNYECCKRRNELVQQSEIRHLSELGRMELNNLIDDIFEFKEVLINFD